MTAGGTGAGINAGALRSSGLLIYDADCGFCQWSLAKGRQILPVMPHTEAFQHTDLNSYGITVAQATAALQFVPARGPVAAGHLAVAGLLMGQPALHWRFAGALLTIPPISWVAALIYRWVAAHRHLLPGATAACAVPTRT